MRAGEFVFRQRFWFIAVLFFLGFSAYNVDHRNVVVAVAMGAGVDPKSDDFDLWIHAGFGFGALLVVLAAALRTWAAAYLTSAVVHDANLHAERLVADGPYRHVRNPLYLGLLLLVSGFAFAASRIGFVFLVSGALALTLALIVHEEEQLARAQGEAFEAYRRAVPRLLFSPWPRIPASGRRPLVAQAFLGESFFWVFAAASVVFAVNLDVGVLGWFSAAGLAVYAGSLLVARRLRSGRPE